MAIRPPPVFQSFDFVALVVIDVARLTTERRNGSPRTIAPTVMPKIEISSTQRIVSLRFIHAHVAVKARALSHSAFRRMRKNARAISRSAISHSAFPRMRVFAQVRILKT
jgi:hypothetical protein